MRIVVSGWFWERPSAGSGQYLRRLLPHLMALPPSNGVEKAAKQQPCAPRYTLLLPQQPPTGGDAEYSPSDRQPRARASESKSGAPHLQIAVISPPRQLPRQLAKLYWEQVVVPRAARHLRADVLLVPYWAAPLWQPMPTVVTVHDLIPLLLPVYRAGWLGRLYTGLVSHTTRRCAAILTVSEAGKRDIIAHLGTPAERVFAVHHGPNVEIEPAARRHRSPGNERSWSPGVSTHKPGERQVAQKYALPERYFLYLGGFDARKNLLGIVRAYRRYLDQNGDPAVQLVVAGKLPLVDTAFYPDPQRLVRHLNLTGQVRFIGWVNEDDKAQLYAGATAFLFPSTYEGFGMMLLEAMAAGTPVITSSE